MSLTVALSKGKLLAGSEALFRRAGLPFPEGEGRKLVVSTGGLRFLFVKDMDVPTYVEYGVADCGIAGRDVLLEAGSDVYEPLDLGFGRCRLVLAHRKAEPFAYASTSTVRVATKYPRIAARHFEETGRQAEIVEVKGSVELAPLTGLVEAIVDLTATGTTLRENDLVVREEILDCTARLIANPVAHKLKAAPIDDLLARLRALPAAAGQAPLGGA